MKVLYAGQLGPGELCRVRMEALARAGAEVHPFDYTPWYAWVARSFVLRGLRRASRALVFRGMNQALRRRCRELCPDALYVDKGVDLTGAMLVGIREDARAEGRGMLLVHYHPDHAFHHWLLTREYLGSFREYDCHFCPHPWVVDEHLERGARRAVYLPYGFDPASHFREFRPGDTVEEGELDVAFVGRWEEERGRWLEELAASGVRVSVWGPMWPERLRRGGPLDWRGPFADFARQRRIYGTARVSLGLLSVSNHDGHTSRTFEVPACGGFMLAERTTGQCAFFEEGKEMGAFRGPDELVARTRHYLEHEVEREAIREAGYARCVGSGYDYVGRMRQVLLEMRRLRDSREDARGE